MEITEVRVTLRNEEKLKGFANITLDNQIVIRGLKIIAGTHGYFVSMPSRKRPDGSHQDIAHPVNSETRKMVEDKVLMAYEETLKADNRTVSAESSVSTSVSNGSKNEAGNAGAGSAEHSDNDL